jgi:hypothetical protein
MEILMSAAIQRLTPSVTSEAEAIARVVRRVRQQFPEMSVEIVEHAVHGNYERFDGRPVRDFAPILIERAARSDLVITQQQPPSQRTPCGPDRPSRPGKAEGHQQRYESFVHAQHPVLGDGRRLFGDLLNRDQFSVELVDSPDQRV